MHGKLATMLPEDGTIEGQATQQHHLGYMMGLCSVCVCVCVCVYMFGWVESKEGGIKSSCTQSFLVILLLPPSPRSPSSRPRLTGPNGPCLLLSSQNITSSHRQCYQNSVCDTHKDTQHTPKNDEYRERGKKFLC
jgi:hypothetical protein